MKKILISMLLLVPLFTGCANVDTKITINDDKSATVATSVSYEGDLANDKDAVAVLIHDNFSKYLDKSYKVDKAFSSKLSTIIATKGTKDVQIKDLDLSSLGFVSNLPDKKFIDYKKRFLAKSYNIDMTYDFTQEAAKYAEAAQKAAKAPAPKEVNQDGLNPEYYEQYMDPNDVATEDNAFAQNLDETVVKPAAPEEPKPGDNKMPARMPAADNVPLTVFVSIQVPGVAFVNNADSSYGNLYTWHIKQDEPTNIKIQYVKYNGFGIFAVIAAGILILILGAKKIIKHENQKRIGNGSNLAQ